MATIEHTADKYAGDVAFQELMKCIHEYITNRITPPIITEEVNTDTEYKLKITNSDGTSFVTPNLLRIADEVKKYSMLICVEDITSTSNDTPIFNQDIIVKQGSTEIYKGKFLPVKDPNSNKGYFEISEYFPSGNYNVILGSKTQLAIITSSTCIVNFTFPTSNNNDTI